MSAVAEIVEKIEKLTLLEAVELKKALEDKFGVTAAAPMMMGGGMAAAGGSPGGRREDRVYRPAEGSRRSEDQRDQGRPRRNRARPEGSERTLSTAHRKP